MEEIATQISGTNTVDGDAYFLRLSNIPDFYIHPVEERKDAVEYMVKKGFIGAAIFHKVAAEGFIKQTGYKNLQLVAIKEVLGNNTNKN